MGRRSAALSLVILLLAGTLSGCIFSQEEGRSPAPDETQYPSIWDRHSLQWETSGTYSLVLDPGPYEALEVQEAMVSVDTSSVWETGPSTSEVHISYWLPNNTEEGDREPEVEIV